MSTTTDIVIISNIDKKKVPKYFLIMYVSIRFSMIKIVNSQQSIVNRQWSIVFLLFGSNKSVFYKRLVTRSSIIGFQVWKSPAMMCLRASFTNHK